LAVRPWPASFCNASLQRIHQVDHVRRGGRRPLAGRRDAGLLLLEHYDDCKFAVIDDLPIKLLV
jgi:hypothetical protein